LRVIMRRTGEVGILSSASAGEGADMAMPEGPVIVGLDGSDQPMTAAAWAADEADRRHAEVRVVLVNDDPAQDERLWETLQGIVDRLSAQHPALGIYPKIARGHPAAELIRRSAKAQLVVVGSRGRGPVTGTLLGSVSAKVATHAHCPVVVVREPHEEGPVVVGLDGSQQSQAALEFAFEAAAERGTELVAMQVWQETAVEYPVLAPLDIDLAEQKERVRASLVEQLAGWGEKYPNVPVRAVAQRGHVVLELVHSARDARMVVVGHRGRGGFAELLLGSVASGVLHHAPWVVAVVRGDNP
jgi:nucleotide-binding universal stress UspA family protein